jgi:sugar phosphate isomerase/epimerase
MAGLTESPFAMPMPASMKYLLSLPVVFLSAIAPLRAAGIPDELKTNGFAIGCQAWTFNKFSVMEAIDKTAETGGKVIELFPGQKLSPEEKDVKFSHDSSPEVWEKVKKKLKEKNITPIAYGVVGLDKDEAKSRKVFEFAKAFGIRVINTESATSIDTIEKLVKEFDIKVGFHDHPKREDKPDYRMWDPNYILELVKDRDIRIGACADTGHWVRSGLKPVDCLRILKGRVVSSHLKDLHAPLPSGPDVPYGTGVSDVPGILDEFRAQGFEGPISVEYEYNWENNTGDARQCIEFVKNYKKAAK